MKKTDESDPSRPPGCGWIEIGMLSAVVLLVAALVLPSYLRSRRDWRTVSGVKYLKSITIAEAIFREGDKEQDGNLDYGMLSELGNTSLVDAELGRGTKEGYLFQATYSYVTSEFLWFATAEPQEPDEGDRYFVNNQAGVIFYTTMAPFLLDTNTCGYSSPIGGGTPVGRH